MKKTNLLLCATTLCCCAKSFCMEPYGDIKHLNNSDPLMLKQGIKTSKPDPMRVKRIAGVVKDDFYKNYGITAEQVIDHIKIKAQMAQKYLNYARERADRYTDTDKQIRRSKIFNRVMRKYVKTGDIYFGIPAAEQRAHYKAFRRHVLDNVVPMFGLDKSYIHFPAAGHYRRATHKTTCNEAGLQKNCDKPGYYCKCAKPNCRPTGCPKNYDKCKSCAERKEVKSYGKMNNVAQNNEEAQEIDNNIDLPRPMPEEPKPIMPPRPMISDEAEQIEDNIDLPRPMPEEPKPFLPRPSQLSLKSPMPMPEEPKPIMPPRPMMSDESYQMVEDTPDIDASKDSQEDDSKLKNSEDVDMNKLDEIEEVEPENNKVEDEVEEVEEEHMEQNTP